MMIEDVKPTDEDTRERDRQEAENYRKVVRDTVEWMEGSTHPNMSPRSDCG